MRRFHLIAVLVVALLGGVVALAITGGWAPNRGLDLQGGLEVVLEAQAPPGSEITDSDLDRSIEIMRSRVDKLGVAEPEIRKQPPNQIIIELPGIKDPERAAELVGQTAQLQFYDLEGDLVVPSISTQGFPVASAFLYPILKGLQEQAKQGTPSAWYVYDAQKTRLAGPRPTKEDLLRSLPGGVEPEGAEFLAVPENRIVITCGANADVCPGVNESPPARTYYYLFEYDPANAENPVPEMTGEDLELRGTRQDFDQTGQSIVLMQFTDDGGDTFHDITRELAIRGRLKTGQLASEIPLNQHFAIVLDGEIRSWPSIDFQENPDGISGQTGAQITGLGSAQEAKELALVLQTGALPVRFEQVDRTDVSATLGKDSLRQALIAAVGGLIAVALFLLAVYRFLGVVAIVGLAIYGALLYGAILLFGVTLTLPGFAGLALTIGVAVDANIVIFERIKEEVRLGKSVRAAIPTGYRRGFSTIVDANVVTMITAFVLFAVASGGVKGFALMLLIGTLLSMFTAVAATRAMLGLLSGSRWFDNPAFMGATALRIPRWQRIDFMGKRRVWFALSGAIALIGAISLGVQGLNLGIDFRGGSQLTFTTQEPLPVERVREVASAVIPASAIVQGRGEAADGGYSSFHIRSEPLPEEQLDRLKDTLVTELALEEQPSSRTVSGSFSSQILRNAILAVCVSLVLIFVYVTFRFQWKFAAPVLAALLHDLFITFGVYSVTQRELTTATVAAVLTVLGYSIYDTIIIFDRVRENIPLMRKSSFAAIANQSIWETIRRSIATTLSTLLPVLALLLFGGDTLKDFAFALLVGIFSGAYSTIFIASPLLTILKEREPEYSTRRGQVDPLEKSLGDELEAPAAPAPPAPARGRRRRGAAAAPAQVGPATAGAAPPPHAGVGGDVARAEAPPPPAPDEARPVADAAARREARRQRRRSRPHGRAR